MWLAIRNTLLEKYLVNLLAGRGANIQRYNGKEIHSADILICDYAPHIHVSLLAQIEFSTEHIGSPQTIKPGYWVLSTSTLLEIIPLLNSILLEQQTFQPLQLPAPIKISQDNNSDLQILVVDDHPINRCLLADQLTALGYPVITANDGVDALAVLSNNHIEIILTDVNMPNMDGYNLTRRLRQLNFNFPIIGVTANALAEEKQCCMDAGMDNCLSKPVTLDTLRQMLSYYSEKVRRIRDISE